jgi:hypothetical protein
MEVTVVLVLVLTFLVGGMMLALVMGYRSIEESRASQNASVARTPGIADGVLVPGFFAPADRRSYTAADIAFDEALLRRLAQHVQAEHATVAQFVHFPSVDSLYQQSGSSLHVH